MPDKLHGRVAIVTGGASGIGAATVRAMHAAGASVVIADIQDDLGEQLAWQLGERARYRRTNMAREQDISDVVDLAVTRYGRLDIMFNNAGVMGALGPIDKTPADAVDHTIGVNLRSVILGMKHAARVMKAQQSGVILSTSSPAGMLGGVGPHVYSATKAGVIALSNSVAAELRPFNIRVNTVVPGAVVTPMTAALLVGESTDLDGTRAQLDGTALMNRSLQPEDVAAAAMYLCSDDAAFVTGVTLPVDAGLTGASGASPFATGRYEEPVSYYEAGRTSLD